MRLHIVSALTILGIVLAGVPASAETVISNQIQVSANSGGNTASDGDEIQGESQSQVVIRTEVNGEVVVDKSWTATSSGEPIVVNESISIESSTYEVNADVKVSINSTSTENTTTTTVIARKAQEFVEELWRTLINTFTQYVDRFWN